MKFFDFHHHNLDKDFGIYNLKFQQEPPQNCFSAGIHPDSISENIEEQFHWLKEISRNKNCVAIGECGLDGLIEIDEKLQEEVFEKQIQWANEIKKPLIIHCVRRFFRLTHFQKISKVPMIVHGFNKRKSIGMDLLQHDFYLSFGKSVLYDVNLQTFLSDFPLNKIFLETDSADFAIEELYHKVALIKKMEVTDLITRIAENLQNI